MRRVASLLLSAACGACGATQEGAPGVAHYDRPPGMPIGTGAAGGELEEPAPATDNADLAIVQYQVAAAPEKPAPPCAGCVELDVYVNDINQRDEFTFAAGDVPITRVVWTLRVTFNSDQLAVQPFVDDAYGKYTNLHVNTFPLGAPVEVEQVIARRAGVIGLVLGSSGAWTGDQIIGVFVDSVRVEGPRPFEKSFDAGPDGLAPRTDRRQPKVIHYPAP
ncbi:MAG TPA: hypothetical protein VNN80_18445 [Polyangiaceae bacterium]|jgi:hypothetical protein|nr:hypothetical protein [Polyangiaceae bacterium]